VGDCSRVGFVASNGKALIALHSIYLTMMETKRKKKKRTLVYENDKAARTKSRRQCYGKISLSFSLSVCVCVRVRCYNCYVHHTWCVFVVVYLYIIFLSLSLSLPVLSLLVIIQLAGDAIDELFGRRTGRAG